MQTTQTNKQTNRQQYMATLIQTRVLKIFFFLHKIVMRWEACGCCTKKTNKHGRIYGNQDILYLYLSLSHVSFLFPCLPTFDPLNKMQIFFFFTPGTMRGTDRFQLVKAGQTHRVVFYFPSPLIFCFYLFFVRSKKKTKIFHGFFHRWEGFGGVGESTIEFILISTHS